MQRIVDEISHSTSREHSEMAAEGLAALATSDRNYRDACVAVLDSGEIETAYPVAQWLTRIDQAAALNIIMDLENVSISGIVYRQEMIALLDNASRLALEHQIRESVDSSAHLPLERLARACFLSDVMSICDRKAAEILEFGVRRASGLSQNLLSVLIEKSTTNRDARNSLERLETCLTGSPSKLSRIRKALGKVDEA